MFTQTTTDLIRQLWSAVDDAPTTARALAIAGLLDAVLLGEQHALQAAREFLTEGE